MWTRCGVDRSTTASVQTLVLLLLLAAGLGESQRRIRGSASEPIDPTMWTPDDVGSIGSLALDYPMVLAKLRAAANESAATDPRRSAEQPPWPCVMSQREVRQDPLSQACQALSPTSLSQAAKLVYGDPRDAGPSPAGVVAMRHACLGRGVRKRTVCDKTGIGAGNVFGFYLHARAMAAAGGLHFLLLDEPVCTTDHAETILAYMPRIAVSASGGGNITAARERACGVQPRWYHLGDSWLPFATRLRVEVRAALAAWSERNSHPPPTAPHDDFVIHIRCGDVLALGHDEYGLLPFAAQASLVPSEATTVGIVSMDHESLCARNLSDHNKDYRTRRQRNRAGRTAPQCACQCAKIVEALAATISTKRPDVSVSVHSKEHSLAGWSRMAFSNMATLCNPSTFCLYPTMAHSIRGMFVESTALVPHAATLAELLPVFEIVTLPQMVSYRTLHGAAANKDCPAGGVHPDLTRA